MAKSKSTDFVVEAIKRIDDATKKISGDVDELKLTAAEQQIILAEHIRRTEANEALLEAYEARVKPLEDHISMWAGAWKVLAGLGVLASIAGAVYKIFVQQGG